jgi:hypothetical protein
MILTITMDDSTKHGCHDYLLPSGKKLSVPSPLAKTPATYCWPCKSIQPHLVVRYLMPPWLGGHNYENKQKN